MATEAANHELLLRLARRSIVEGIGGDAPAPTPQDLSLPPPLLEPAATFVTLKRLGLLRGCRGLLEPVRPLAWDVWHNAWASAFDDPRFPRLTASELEDLEVGISILSALERIRADTESAVLESIEPGRHGLVLAFGPRRATFLPQVWRSLGDRGRFMEELKGKAGLPRDFWSPQMEAWRYTVTPVGSDD